MAKAHFGLNENGQYTTAACKSDTANVCRQPDLELRTTSEHSDERLSTILMAR